MDQTPPDPNLMAAVQTCNEMMQQKIMTHAALIVAQRELADARAELTAIKDAAKEPDAANGARAARAVRTVLNGTAPHDAA